MNQLQQHEQQQDGLQLRAYLCPTGGSGNYPSVIEEDAEGEQIQSSMNLEDERDQPVSYGGLDKKRKKNRQTNNENNPPGKKLAKNLFGGPVFNAKDPFSEKPQALFTSL